MPDPIETPPTGSSNAWSHIAVQTSFEPSGRLNAAVRSAAKGGGITDSLPTGSVGGRPPDSRRDSEPNPERSTEALVGPA